MRRSVNWQERAGKWFCILSGLGLAWATVRYVPIIPTVLLVVWGVSAAIQPIARKTSEILRLPRRLCAALTVLLAVGILGGGLLLLAGRLLREIEELLAWLGENGAYVGERVGAVVGFLETAVFRFSFFEGNSRSASADQIVSGIVNETLQRIGGAVTAWITSFVQGAPRLLLTGVVTVMACFYGSMEYESVRTALLGLLPPPLSDKAEMLRRKVSEGLRRYIRAYLILFALTFCEALLGLLILRQRYAALIALGIAAVDMLPILGTGTVLIPWALLSFGLGNAPFALGLLILYGVITLVRQIAEPHIVGGSFGVPPLTTLLFTFVGFQLFGIFGMLLGPVAVLTVKEILLSVRSDGE